MGVSSLLRLFISSNEVYDTAIHKQNSIFKDTETGPMIPKEIKYNLHYDEVRVPHGTNTSCSVVK